MSKRLLYCSIALLLKFEISLRLGQTDIIRQGRCMLAEPRSIFLFPQIRSTRAATLCYNCDSRFHFYIHTVPIYVYMNACIAIVAAEAHMSSSC